LFRRLEPSFMVNDDIPFSFLLLFFCAPKSIYCFNSTISGCDGGNRTRNVAVDTWCLSPLSYNRHPLSYNRHPPSWSTTTFLFSFEKPPTVSYCFSSFALSRISINILRIHRFKPSLGLIEYTARNLITRNNNHTSY
jgi:hypothetical protein